MLAQRAASGATASASVRRLAPVASTSVLANSTATAAARRARVPQWQQQSAGLHDIAIKQKTGLPVQSAGPFGGGRNAVSGHVATVFGCTGFLGRYLVNRLSQKGTQVVVPYRDEDTARHLKPMGDLGQIVPMEWDARNEDQIEECMRHSDVVYNLVGRDYETKNFKYDDVNVKVAGKLAAMAEELGVSRFIHVSHLNADHNSPSAFYRTKAQGEDAVRSAFQGATIVRPGPLFGHEDRFLNQMSVYPLLWHVNYGATKVRPVHSVDVAHALTIMCDADNTSMGQTFSLAGPRSYNYNELLVLIESLTFNKLRRVGLNVPKWALRTATKIGDLAWWQMLSPDEVERRFINDKPDAPGTLGFADLGIEPDTLDERAILYLRRYRSQLRFEQPVEGSGMKLKKGKYHVVD